MKKPTLNHCPCGANMPYPSCCGTYIDQNTPAPASTAEKLMRSRYSAYTRNNSDYLLKTWHTTTRPTSLDLAQEPATEWLGLKICHSEAGGADEAAGSVEFIACYRVEGKTVVIHEVSRFIKEAGRWYYVDGQLSQPSQNSPCPCRSGKKFKRCCGIS